MRFKAPLPKMGAIIDGLIAGSPIPGWPFPTDCTLFLAIPDEGQP